MTLADVRRQILVLGFETEDDYDDDANIMTEGLNMAMRLITNVFPIIGQHKIANYPLPNLLGADEKYLNSFHYDGKTKLTFTADGAKSFYFEYAGSGTLTIKSDAGTNTVALTGSRKFAEYKAFASGSVTLTFSGDYSFDVRNVAIYGQLFSASVDDIPAYRKHIRYDFIELTKSNGIQKFGAFEDKIAEGNYDKGESYLSMQDFTVEGNSVLVLDGRANYEYTVFYRKMFTPFTTTTADNTEIELSFDKQHLLPLLAAWYVWRDDNPTIAAQCKNDYEDAATILLSQRGKYNATEQFNNELRW